MKNIKIIFWLILSFPAALFAQFDGVVGSEGCKAISCDDARIIEWAISCEITRGYQDVGKPQNGYASFGMESAAVGKAESADPTQAVSLGDSGVAVLGFQTPVANGEGYDFAVFENSFNDHFLELAFVEVSSDGIHYFRFPAVSNIPTDVQIGDLGGMDAALLYNLAGKYRIGWGTPFDLEELDDDENLDKNNIRYIKIIDVIGCVEPPYASYDKNGNIINDPYPTNYSSSGFDLTGVGVIHNQNNVAVSEHQEWFVSAYPNPCQDVIHIHANGYNMSIYNGLGQKLQQRQLNENISQIDMSNYPAGVYVIHLQNNQTKKCIKISKRK
ncbi:MAG: T9SS type A sorting domain-containing protein [Bacteroidales bacterium]|nr:T9SS type A sorting domain-containing protein [Bacteroidales bacterium]